ncbi:MAG: peptidoglycan-binding protein, partial [Okeania sp. SIO2H7]|nr:peptidoglycan-binding protein [Okeania sp. SIO2H7]
MTLKLTCCVCDRPGIEGNICPNCETDLSMVRMLMELPIQPAVPAASEMST